MPSVGGALSGAGTGAKIGSSFGPWGTAIGAGIGGLAGLFGGGASKLDKEREEALRYWLRRIRDQEEQATAWGEGNRTWLERILQEQYGEPGYTEEERAGRFYSPEEIERMRIGPEEEAGIVSTAIAPTVGAANRARDELMRAAAARGGYAPGLNAAVARTQEEGGRQAAEAGLGARLGITAMRRAADEAIARQRVGAVEDIGKTRIGGQRFGTQARLGLQELDQARMLGYGRMGAGAVADTQGQEPWWRRFLRGTTDALSNADWEGLLRKKKKNPFGGIYTPPTADLGMRREVWDLG